MVQKVFEKLQALQDVLLKKYKIEKEIENIPKAIITQKELLIRLKKQFIDKSTVLEKKQQKVKEFKTKLKEAEELRSKFERDMDIIKTQKEYELFDKSIKEAIATEQQLRKDLLKEEKETEELNQAVEKDAALIKGQEDELAGEEEKIESESEEKKMILMELREKEKKIIPDLDEEILFKFERIIRSKEGLGIVPVKGIVCSACHMILPAQFVNNVRHGDEILFCPYCSRILFYEETEDENEMVFARNDNIGGFAGLAEEEDEEIEEGSEDMDEDSSDTDSKAGGFSDGEEDDEIVDDEDDEEDEEIFDDEEDEGFSDEEEDDEIGDDEEDEEIFDDEEDEGFSDEEEDDDIDDDDEDDEDDEEEESDIEDDDEEEEDDDEEDEEE